MSRKIIIAGLCTLILGVGLWQVTKVSAQSSSPGIQSIIQRLAQKFGVNETEVEKVFTDYRSERQQANEAAYETRLNELVQSGKITEDQKNLILNKHKEIQTKWQADKTARQQERADLEKWAQANNIDLQYVIGLGGHGKGNGKGMGMGFGMGRGMHGDWDD